MLSASLAQAARNPAMLSTSTIRTALTRRAAAAPLVCRVQQARQAHAISNPTLANIEKRWEDMPPQEQADLWMSLRDRMKVDWRELTLQEKKAAYYIAFGPHGPRRPPPPNEGWKVFAVVSAVIAASGALFFITRLFANPVRPRTMTKEWQEATEEYFKEQGTEPITGYKGMMIQSPSEKDIPASEKINDE